MRNFEFRDYKWSVATGLFVVVFTGLVGISSKWNKGASMGAVLMLGLPIAIIIAFNEYINANYDTETAQYDMRKAIRNWLCVGYAAFIVFGYAWMQGGLIN